MVKYATYGHQLSKIKNRVRQCYYQLFLLINIQQSDLSMAVGVMAETSISLFWLKNLKMVSL